MKKLLLIACLCISTTVFAQVQRETVTYPAPSSSIRPMELARVITVSPIIEQVTTGQNCVIIQPEHSYGGMVAGALLGGLLGHQIGRGTGNTAATIVGGAAGAAAGDNLGNKPQQNCTPIVEQRINGYRYQAQYENIVLNGVTQKQINIGDMVNVRVTKSVNLAE